MGRLWLLIVLLPLSLCSSCFRAANVQPSELRKMTVDKGSARLVYKNGDSLRIAHFDSITVETNAPQTGMTVDPNRSEQPSEREFVFDATTRGSLSAPLLRLEDQHSRRVFPLAQVENINLESYSPGRPWLILAAAGIGALAGGLIGSAAAPCNDEGNCMEKAAFALVSMPIGFGVGLAVGFPLTRGLGTSYPARDVPRGAE